MLTVSVIVVLSIKLCIKLVLTLDQRYEAVLGFEYVDEMLKRYHSQAKLLLASFDTICYSVQVKVVAMVGNLAIV